MFTKGTKIKFNFFVNYFLVNGREPAWMEEAIECLELALTQSNQQGITTNIYAKISQKDLTYFTNKFKHNIHIHSKCLPERSSSRRFPYLADILTGNNESSNINTSEGSMDYIIYANADICIPRYFFEFTLQQIELHRSLEKGITSFMVNRKDIVSKKETGPESQKISMHPGYDLFVFHASILTKLALGKVAIGTPPVGCTLAINLANYSEKIKIINDIFISWHRGKDQNWRHLKEERLINQIAAQYAVKELSEKLGIQTTKLKTAGMDEILISKKPLASFISRVFRKLYRSIKMLISQ